MLARDVMTREPITEKTTATVADVMDVMLNNDIRHVPIVQGHELVGVVSDRDLRQFSRAALAVGAVRQLRAPVSKVMSGDVLTVDPEDDVDDVIEVMLENKVGAVPVVNGDGKLVGIVSYVDILRAASGKL
jgi:CBS domain-containing protein